MLDEIVSHCGPDVVFTSCLRRQGTRLSLDSRGRYRCHKAIYVPVPTGHGSAGNVPHFISPLMIPQNKLYVPDDSTVFGAALLSQCFLSVRVSDRTARTSDRWQLSVSRREKEEPIVVMIFFSSHLLFETCKDPAPRRNTNYTGFVICELHR